MKKLYILLLILGATTYAASAQEPDFDLGPLLQGGVNNAEPLLTDYLQPAFEGFGYAINAGWYNTGKPHKLFGFDITFGATVATIPSSKYHSRFNAANYDDVTLGKPRNYGKNDLATSLFDNNELPTIVGPHYDPDDMPSLIFNASTESPTTITAPQGSSIEYFIKENTGFNMKPAMPAPFVQLGIGLIKNTELKIRYVPNLPGAYGDGFTLNMFGLGVMHDVKQWIPGIKNLPFDLSGFFAFNSLKATAILDDKLAQSANFDVTGTTLQAIISKKLSVLTVYGGLGFTTSKTEFKLLGDYANHLPDGTENTIDPITITSTGNGGMRANVGARLKLLILTIHAEYAIQEYNTLTAGIGLSIR